MKNIYVIIIFLTCPCGYGSSKYSESKTSTVCFITTAGINVSVDALREGYLYGGAQLAFKHFKKQNPKKKINLKHLPVDGNDLALIGLLESLEKTKCSIVTGLITSRESLLAAPILKRKNIFIVSSTASHPTLSKYSGSFISAVNSADDFTKAMATGAGGVAGSNIFVLRYLEDLYSEYYAQSLTAHLNSKSTTVLISREGILTQSQFLEIVSKPNPIIIVTALALPSLPVVNQLVSNWPKSKKVRVLGSPSWALDPVTFNNKNVLTQTNLSFEYVASFDPKAKLYRALAREFQTEYDVLPQPNVAFAYDAAFVSFECADTAFHSIDKCIKSLKYTGWTGPLNFSKEGVFAEKRLRFLRLQDYLEK